MGSLTAPRTATTLAPPAVALRLLSDQRLARMAASGSRPAFAAIFERHHAPLHRYCHSIVGNGHDAADALQNTMLKALRALPGETREIALKPWLYRIAHNESISLLRARRPDSELEAAAGIGDAGAAPIAQSREDLRELAADLRELTESQRGALLMRELGGLEFAEVAAALQVSAAAAKQSVYEARCALQALKEGRAMDCDAVRRTLSDGDRRTLRATRMRGHLRACAGCRDFEAALRHRPGQLAMLAPPLPVGLAASILSGMLGGGGGGGGAAGGGLAAAGLGTAAQTGGAFSLGAKAAAIAMTATVAGGAAVYVVPDERPLRSPAALGGDAGQDGRTQAAERKVAGDDAVTTRRPVDAAAAGKAKRDAAGQTSKAPGTTKAPGATARERPLPPPPAARPRPRPAPSAGADADRDAPTADSPGGGAAPGPEQGLGAAQSAVGATPAAATPAGSVSGVPTTATEAITLAESAGGQPGSADEPDAPSQPAATAPVPTGADAAETFVASRPR
jgi:RNA polymerase sigma factor (sigma-70 family)